MGLHSSLKIDLAGAQQRTVLTRIERIKDLMKKDLWPEGRAVTGLPKIKIIKVKTRKAKKEETAPEQAAAGTAPVDAKAAAAAKAPAAGAKAAPAAKPTAASGAAKAASGTKPAR